MRFENTWFEKVGITPLQIEKVLDRAHDQCFGLLETSFIFFQNDRLNYIWALNNEAALFKKAPFEKNGAKNVIEVNFTRIFGRVSETLVFGKVNLRNPSHGLESVAEMYVYVRGFYDRIYL